MDYLRTSQPHNIDLHEFDEKVDTGKNVSTDITFEGDSELDQKLSQTARSLSQIASTLPSFNPDARVDGCGDLKRKKRWINHCTVSKKIEISLQGCKRSS